MASEERARAAASPTPPKVIGLGAPTSVWIYFEIAEIPALIDAIGDEFARHGGSAQIHGRTVEPRAGVDPTDWRYHVGELQRMLGDVEQAAETRVHGRFDVLWPTVMAHGVVHGAVGHAERRATAAGDEVAARDALAAAQRTLRDFQAVDGGGLDAVWL
jgi:hypothetical protein